MNILNIATENITAIDTHNGRNIVKTCREFFGKTKYLPCFARTLDLVASRKIGVLQLLMI